MTTTEQIALDQRARLRNAGTWVSFDWGGLMEPLTDQQEAMNLIARAAIENFMAISDEAWTIKESQRDRSSEVAMAEISQDVTIAELKSETGRQKLAIQRATDEYVLASRIYDAKAKAAIMGAKEYAALVEQEQLGIEAERAGLAVDKEALRLMEVNAKIYYEVIQRAQVEADLAKAQVDVAKAHVRAVMADIEAGQAEVKVIEAQVAVVMAEAEKAGLQADVASVFAEILTKQLSTIKLNVGRAEILAGFRYIQSKLDDELAIWTSKIETETAQTTIEGEIYKEVGLGLTADEIQDNLRVEAADRNQKIFEYEKTQTETNIEDEKSLKEKLVTSRKDLADAKLDSSMSRDDKQTWALALTNAAQRYVHKHSQIATTAYETQYEYIGGE